MSSKYDDQRLLQVKEVVKAVLNDPSESNLLNLMMMGHTCWKQGMGIAPYHVENAIREAIQEKEAQ